MNQDGPFNKDETVEDTATKRIGRVQGMENGKYKVLFEGDNVPQLLAESALKRKQILFG